MLSELKSSLIFFFYYIRYIIIMYEYVYFISFIISLYLFIYNIKKIYPYKNWFYKNILIFLAGGIMLYSLFYDNKTINNYILPILLVINIAILFFVTLNNKYTIINILPLFGIIYILGIFNIKDFVLKKGKLVNLNKQWIYKHIVVLIIYYLFLNKSAMELNDRIGAIIIILYPLLFPLNEYYIHRIFSLSLMTQIAWI